VNPRTTPLAFFAGVAVGSLAAYYFAIRPLALAAELSAQAGFMLIQAKAREADRG